MSTVGASGKGALDHHHLRRNRRLLPCKTVPPTHPQRRREIGASSPLRSASPSPPATARLLGPVRMEVAAPSGLRCRAETTAATEAASPSLPRRGCEIPKQTQKYRELTEVYRNPSFCRGSSHRREDEYMATKRKQLGHGHDEAVESSSPAAVLAKPDRSRVRSRFCFATNTRMNRQLSSVRKEAPPF